MSEAWIDVPGGRVWYSERGSGRKPPVLCVHGGPGLSSSNFRPLQDAFADERRVIRYDQLGGGKSWIEPDLAICRPERFSEELSAVRVALGLGDVHIVAHSWGTALAVQNYLDGPDGMRSLTLCGPWLDVPRYMRDVERLRRGLPPEIRDALDRHEAAETFDDPEYEAAMFAFLNAHTCRNLEVLLAMLGEFGEGPKAWVYEAMWGPNEFRRTSDILVDIDLTPRLGDLRVPVLYASGRYDECTPEAAADFAALTPMAEVVVFEQSAHMSMLEEPDAFAEVLRGFFAGVEGMSETGTR